MESDGELEDELGRGTGLGFYIRMEMIRNMQVSGVRPHNADPGSVRRCQENKGSW